MNLKTKFVYIEQQSAGQLAKHNEDALFSAMRSRTTKAQKCAKNKALT
jgi:hypothetical protein